MSELILIRHGRSRGNANKGVIQGSGPDPANTLDSAGEGQAQKLGRTLAAARIIPDGVWSSPLKRARQTCDIALAVVGCDLPVTEDERLREMCKGLEDLPGGMEGRRREEVETPAYWQQYKEQGWDFRHGSRESKGETAREVGARVLDAINDIADNLDGGRGLVFTHGQAIRFGVGAALHWPDIDLVNAEYLLGNCEGIIMNRDAGLWQVAGRIACSTAV
jgi:probable phosphoglycerate mutase